MSIKSILENQDIRMEGEEHILPELLSIIDKALEVADNLAVSELSLGSSSSNVQIRLATSSAAQTVTALLGAALTKCYKAMPPEDVDVKHDVASGRLIYRCYHNPDHEWNLDGTERP